MPEAPGTGAGVAKYISFYLKAAIFGVGHVAVDVLPYKLLGGNVRGPECAVGNCPP